MNLTEMDTDDLAQEALILLVDKTHRSDSMKYLVDNYDIEGLDEETRSVIQADDEPDIGFRLDDLKVTFDDIVYDLQWINGEIFAVNREHIDRWDDANDKSFWDEHY